MRSGLAILIAAVLLASGCGGGGEAGGTTTTGPDTQTDTGGTTETDQTTGPTRCAEEEGLITGYLDPAERDDCGPAERLETLFRADLLTTGEGGTLQYCLASPDCALDPPEGTNCDMRPEASVLIGPDAQTALQLLGGTVDCVVEGEHVRLTAPGAEIEIDGTSFTLSASDDTTTVKVHEGTLRILSTADRDAGFQVLPEAGDEQRAAARLSTDEPLQRITYVTDAFELERIAILRLGIIILPPGALPELTSEAAATGGSVVTETSDQGTALQERELVVALPMMTTADLGKRTLRQLVRPEDTVVGVGSFSALQATYEGLRATFGADVTLVYTPYTFPETTTTGTEGETTPSAPTETGPP